MIIAVTGANGFIGRHLCKTLAQRGYETRPVIRADFTDSRFEKIVNGADVVIHAAGATRAPTRAKLRASNVELTHRVIEAVQNVHRHGHPERSEGPRPSESQPRLVFISSQAAAGPARALNEPTREEQPPSPIENYGESKRDTEALVRDSGLPNVVVRPAAVYGPGDRDFRAMFALAHRGLAIHAGNREQWISIIHVRDCVDGIIRAATTNEAVGRTFFLANDAPVQWDTLFQLARNAASAPRRVDVEIPMPLVRVGALFGDAAARLTGHAGLLTTQKVLLGTAPYWVCSNERARRELGFIPATPLAAGIAETYRWYLENGGL